MEREEGKEEERSGERDEGRLRREGGERKGERATISLTDIIAVHI